MARGLQPGDPRLIGPYRLVGQLGRGGMGRVFLGLSAGGRPVAVKVIRAELAADQEFRIRFGREVAAARRVSGLFTALVVDADVDGPVPWLATAYVSGPALSDAVTHCGPMPARSALALAAGLAEGLSAIHAASVVHCDLKPANVLLSQDGPRVIDFGISRAAEAASVTGAGLVVGSPGFMSPEQAMGGDIGPPSDVFSLGAVLAFAATGRGPFGEGSSPELAYRLVYSQPNLDQLPAELRPLVGHCLAKEPAGRPTSDELLAEVAAVQSATGWLPDPTIGALAEYLAPNPVPVAAAVRRASPLEAPGPGRPASGRPRSRADRSPGRDEISRRRWWRPLVATGVAASVLAASAAVSFALSGAVKHPSAAQFQPRVAATRANSAAGPGSSLGTAPSVSPSRASSSPSAFPGVVPADIVPVIDTLTPPGTPSPGRSKSPSPSKSPVPSASPTATTSASATASPSPAPSPSPSASPAPSPSPSASPAPSLSPSASPATSLSPSASPGHPVPGLVLPE